MDRRRFLQVSGFSAASLLFTKVNGEGTAYQGMDFPDEISVLAAGQWISLTGSGSKWSGGGVDIRLEQTVSSLAILAQAPVTTLEKIRLTWKRNFPASANYLGDHWERSYGDLAWVDRSLLHKAPWYLLVHDGRETLAFGVKTGARSFCSWQVTTGGLELALDTLSGGSGVQLGDRVLTAAEIVTTKSQPGETPFQTDHRFCKLLCPKPVLPAQPVYGINDWYFAYGKNSRDLILQITGLMAPLATDTNNRPFSVVDDGWELGADFTRCNERFGDMSSVAGEIKKLGMRPGLWTRPLLAKADDNPAYLIPLRPGQKAGKERHLDPTIAENRHRIENTIRLYKDWGFDLVKHDYTSYDFFGKWGSQMGEGMTVPGWSFQDRSRTNAEILLDLYSTIRRAAGKMYLIGCNTVSHLSAGIFELNRTGDDTSGKEWDRTRKMGVNTMGFRLPQHNAFYAVDGDCVGLTTNIPWKENRQWLQLLAESSAPLFISPQPEALGPEQKEYIKKCYTMAARPQPLGEPLDWLTNPQPAKWKLNGRIVDFDWS